MRSDPNASQKTAAPFRRVGRCELRQLTKFGSIPGRVLSARRRFGCVQRTTTPTHRTNTNRASQKRSLSRCGSPKTAPPPRFADTAGQKANSPFTNPKSLDEQDFGTAVSCLSGYLEGQPRLGLFGISRPRTGRSQARPGFSHEGGGLRRLSSAVLAEHRPADWQITNRSANLG